MTAVDDRPSVLIQCEARGFPFDVRGDDELRASLAELFAPLERSGGDALAVFSIGREGEDRHWHVRMDGQLMMGCEQTGQAVQGLVVYINQRVWMARDDVLSIHAAAVATPHGAVILPANSGSGKTTLCARLLQRGAGYLSDDSVAVDKRGQLLGYPKPLGFKGSTQDLFSDVRLPGASDGRDAVWQVSATRLGAAIVTSAEPAVVVSPRFEPGAALHLDRMSRPAGAAALLQQAQNLPAFGFPEALAIIGLLVAKVPCHSAVYGDADDAAQAVLDLVRPISGSLAPYQLVPASHAGPSATQPVPASDVAALLFDDGALLVREQSGEFITVDAVGARIWSLLDGQLSIDHIADELGDSDGDISRWIAELLRRGFLVTPNSR